MEKRRWEEGAWQRVGANQWWETAESAKRERWRWNLLACFVSKRQFCQTQNQVIVIFSVLHCFEKITKSTILIGGLVGWWGPLHNQVVLVVHWCPWYFFIRVTSSARLISDVRVCALGKLKKLHLEGFLNYGGFGSFIYTSSFSGLVLSPLFIPGKPKSWMSLSSEAEM